MKDLTFITGNQHKADYLASWLRHPVPHKKIDLDEIQSLDIYEVVEHKARQAYDILKKPVLVEDVALSFDAMGRLPGTYIKWFEQEMGLASLATLAQKLENQKATAHICYALYDGEKLYRFEAKSHGVIAPEPRGDGGFGFDGIFIHVGQSQTRAEMNEATYAATSYRAHAIEKLRDFLQQHDTTK